MFLNVCAAVFEAFAWSPGPALCCCPCAPNVASRSATQTKTPRTVLRGMILIPPNFFLVDSAESLPDQTPRRPAHAANTTLNPYNSVSWNEISSGCLELYRRLQCYAD